MKNKNGTYIIGIDHGYGNIKTANCCFPTGVVVSSTEPTFKQDLLVYEGNKQDLLVYEGNKQDLLVYEGNEHRIATAQSSIHTASGCGREGVSPLKTPQKGLIKIEKKTVKHTLRMTEKESRKLKKQAEKAGISQAEFVRQKVFGLEPAPMPDNDFWNHMAALYEIHDQIKEESIRAQLRQLILTIQNEATSPREVMPHGDDEAVAH